MNALPNGQIVLIALKPRDSKYPSDAKTFGDHIRRRRIDLKLLQKGVGQRIGVHCTSIWNWERNRTEPEIKHLPAIISFLGYDPRPKPTTLGERLIAFRLGKGWARPRLAAELRVDPSTLACWETGKKLPWGPHAARVKALVG